MLICNIEATLAIRVPLYHHSNSGNLLAKSRRICREVLAVWEAVETVTKKPEQSRVAVTGEQPSITPV